MLRKKIIGRQPTEHGEYMPGQAYGKKFIVTLFDCGWESKHDNNTSAPATLNAQTGTITENTTDWKKKWGSYEQWLIDNGYQKIDATNVKDGNNNQHQINASFADEIGSDSTPESIKGRITNIEEAVGSGGSVDERIAEEGARHYLKNETYTKEEVNGMITTPNQEYVSIEATEQTTAATDVLPATGAADTIYRVANWDGSQYDASVYSEYAWNGTQYIHLSTKTQIGEVFDISAYHATGGTLATYTDLADALTGTNGGVPQSLQKGGMSIKFVRIDDNMYVQYRLMAASWSTNVSDWQGVDEEPTAGSDNLVKSGGIFGCLEYGTNIPFELKSGKFYDLGANNTITEVNNEASKYLERIDVSSFIGDYIVIQLSNFSTTTSSRIIAIGDSNNIASRYLTEGNPTKVEGSIAQYIMPIDSPYLFISFRSECILDYIKPLNTNVGKAVEDLYDKINEVREESVQDSDIEIDIISNNIFNSDNLHRDALIGNDGDVASAQGWQYALINVEPGQTITFGRFSLRRGGYYAFYNGEPSLSTLVSVSTFDDPDGGVAATVTVPNGAKYLCIDIVSPATIGDESPLFTANYGTILKPYDEYSEAITKINGVKLAGVGSEGIKSSSLIVDLPVSDGTDIESGYAYIDSTDRTIKVKE